MRSKGEEEGQVTSKGESGRDRGGVYYLCGGVCGIEGTGRIKHRGRGEKRNLNNGGVVVGGGD